VRGNSAHSYVAGWVVADALERAGSTDKEAIRDALAKTHLEHGSHMILPAKVLEFDENGQNPNARMYMGILSKNRGEKPGFFRKTWFLICHSPVC